MVKTGGYAHKQTMGHMNAAATMVETNTYSGVLDSLRI